MKILYHLYFALIQVYTYISKPPLPHTFFVLLQTHSKRRWKNPHAALINLFMVYVYGGHKYFYNCQRWNQLVTISITGQWMETNIKTGTKHKYSCRTKMYDIASLHLSLRDGFCLFNTQKALFCVSATFSFVFCFFFSLRIIPGNFSLKEKKHNQRGRKRELEMNRSTLTKA